MNEELEAKIQELEDKIESLEKDSKMHRKWYFEEVEKNKLLKRFIENLKESIDLFTINK